jgi:phosphonate transport system substrate-binding protein
VLFPELGLKPDTDYKPLMSGGHDKSILGVASGDYDMAAVASDVFERMATRGTIKAAEFREIYRSPVFPTSSFAHAHDLKPELAKKLKDCFYAFRFPAEMQKEFNGDDRFLPITYQKDWSVVRDVAAGSGETMRKPGTKGAPTAAAFKASAKTAKKRKK